MTSEVPSLFLSSSGAESGFVAARFRRKLEEWFRVNAFHYSHDIKGGTDWFDVVTKSLCECDAIVVFLTSDNANGSWLNFETGVFLHKRTIFPFVLDCRPTDDGPLNHFQHCDATKEGTKHLLESLGLDKPFTEKSFDRLFEGFWDDVGPSVEKISSELLNRKSEKRAGDSSDEVASKSSELVSQPTSHSANGNASDLWDGELNSPQIIPLPGAWFIRPTVDLKSPNNFERALIEISFGKYFSVDVFLQMVSSRQADRIKAAEACLNAHLMTLFLGEIPIKYRLFGIADKSNFIKIELEIKGLSTTLSPSAIEHLRNVMASLARIDPNLGYFVFVYDEPKPELHAETGNILQKLFNRLKKSFPVVQRPFKHQSVERIE